MSWSIRAVGFPPVVSGRRHPTGTFMTDGWASFGWPKGGRSIEETSLLGAVVFCRRDRGRLGGQSFQLRPWIACYRPTTTHPFWCPHIQALRNRMVNGALFVHLRIVSVSSWPMTCWLWRHVTTVMSPTEIARYQCMITAVILCLINK